MPDLPDSRPVSQLVQGPVQQPATISGRRMTVLVLATLLVTGLLFYWVTTAYGTYNAARRQTDRTWRTLATALDKRYEQYEAAIKRAAAEEKIDRAAADRWQAARDRFKRTTLAAHQVEAARTLEASIAALPRSERLPDDDAPQLREPYTDYVAAVQNQRQVARHAGSRLLKLMLSLPEPLEFSLAE